jgi:hypothetical protein
MVSTSKPPATIPFAIFATLCATQDLINKIIKRKQRINQLI